MRTGTGDAAEQDAADAREMLGAEAESDMRDYLKAEIAEKEARSRTTRGRDPELLLPRDPNEGRNVIVEIQGTEGGEEANLWAGDLFRMYQRYAERSGYEARGAFAASRPNTAGSATSPSS